MFCSQLFIALYACGDNNLCNLENFNLIIYKLNIEQDHEQGVKRKSEMRNYNEKMKKENRMTKERERKQQCNRERK